MPPNVDSQLEQLGLGRMLSESVARSVHTTEVAMIISSLDTLTAMGPTALLSALVDAHVKLLNLRKQDHYAAQHRDAIQNRSDLFARRCELSVAICRDDEQGLSVDQLNRIAEIIWPMGAPPVSIDTPSNG
jgi:hypothetical protein